MTESTCPACRGSRFRGFRARGDTEIRRCLECGSGRLHGVNGNGPRGFTYESEYFESWNLKPGSPAWNLRAATAELRQVFHGMIAAMLKISARGYSTMAVKTRSPRA